jgi:polyhydroxyalkanoate synthase
MVTPPSNTKAFHRVSSSRVADVDAWLRTAERVPGSWWDDWAAWAEPRSGERVPPPSLPDGEPAPGTYVRG